MTVCAYVCVSVCGGIFCVCACVCANSCRGEGWVDVLSFTYRPIDIILTPEIEPVDTSVFSTCVILHTRPYMLHSSTTEP